MSGIEVAGLVLAVFPLMVTGLRQFTEGVKTIKEWKRYHRELSNYVRTLESEATCCQDTLEELFDGIIHSNEEYKALLEDPSGGLWYEPQYEGKLKRRLDHNYNNYLESMRNMLENLTDLQERLGVDESGKIIWDDYSSLRRQLERIRLVLSKNIYKELLGQIKETNRELRECTHQSLKLEPIRAKRRSKRPPVDFKIIRRHARSLYNVMVGGRSWKCRCRKYHVASLRLEPRPWEQETEKAKGAGATSLKFRVLLSKDHSDDGTDLIWKWQELEVEPVETADPIAGLDLSITTLSIASSSKQSIKKTVKFAPSPSPVTIWPPATPSPQKPLTKQINDICIAMHETSGVKEVVGFLTDESISQYRHKVHFLDEKVQPYMDPESLKHILETSKQRRLGFGLSRRDRLYIALTLASSVLQLGGTLWLNRQWTSGDILFLPMGNQGSATPKMDFANPYVSWKVCQADSSPNLITDQDQNFVAHRIPSEILFVLGITLTELCFGQNISELRIEDDHDSTEIMTNFNTASRLIPDVYSESGERYGDVVRRCLKCPPDVRDASLDNEEFQAAVFDSIVTPLSQDFEDFNGSRRIR